ncbi:monooxygenase, partial [Streptomyces sp. OfavH-34-F]|nr:monooxygenase [Streptomyces sp. OfavH-34-F]
ATGAPRRLFEVFAGPHFTLLGFGTGTAGALREAAAAHGDELRAYGVGAAGEPCDLTDAAGHAHTAYGVGPDEDLLVLVRPDNHVGLVAGADEGKAVTEYLGGIPSSGTECRS